MRIQNFDDARVSDGGVDRHSVDAWRAIQEMQGRVHVRAGVSAQRELREIAGRTLAALAANRRAELCRQ